MMEEHSNTASETGHLKDLVVRANHAYAAKSYTNAADLFSEATTLQAAQNGEMAPQNAELLYAYGRCLFHLGVSQSDVLGEKVAAGNDEAGGNKPKKRKREDVTATNEAGTLPLEHEAEAMKGSDDKEAKEHPKPFFQISGDDEEWEDDSASGDDAEAKGNEVEDDDDLATAYEILDIARVLLIKQIQEANNQETADVFSRSEAVKKAKELLADTHGLQAEISLENERFADAVLDSRASLALKQELFDKDNGVVAEAHFKLSLALEFASVTAQSDMEKLANPDKKPEVDERMLEEAAREMEAAIESTRLRLQKAITSLDKVTGQEHRERQNDIDDIKDMISDMEQRLEDLRSPAISMTGPDGIASAESDTNALGSLLRNALGESPIAQRARIEQSVQSVNDLSGIVRRQKTNPPDSNTKSGATEINAKRKASEEVEVSEDGKKAKLEGS